MITNEELIDGINKGMESTELKKIAMRGGMKTLHQDSLLKVKDGVTTLE
jgi:type IV pilus assembly protein PilB